MYFYTLATKPSLEQQENMDSKTNIEDYKALLEQFGVANDLDWLASVLFVRNMVKHLDLFAEPAKQGVQKNVLSEIAKQDLSPEAFAIVVRHIEAFIVENEVTHNLQKSLDAERKDTYALVEEMNNLFTMMRGSRDKQEESINQFGEKTIQVVEGSKSKTSIVTQLRGLVTELVSEFKEEARSWEDRAKSLEHSARHDPLLSDLYNRRSFDGHLDDMVVESQSRGTNLSLLMLDVDNFKKVNDTYGHQSGDDLLRALSAIVMTHSSIIEGYPARYGGEEFVVICLIDQGQAMQVAEFIRRDVENYEFITRNHGQLDGSLNFTVSIGVASLNKEWGADQLVDAADKAMYQAKQSGKNKVVLYDSE